jgi:hypothetical protein
VSGIDDRGSLAGKVSAMVLSNIFLSHVVLIMFVYESILRITDKIISLRPAIYFLWSLKYGEVAEDNPLACHRFRVADHITAAYAQFP